MNLSLRKLIDQTEMELYGIPAKWIARTVWLIAVAIVSAIFYSSLDYLLDDIVIWRIWLLIAVIASSLLTSFVARWVRKRKLKSNFDTFDVILDDAGLLWRLKSTPDYWIDDDISGCSSDFLKSILEGPLCSHDIGSGKRCRQKMYIEKKYGKSDVLKGRCRNKHENEMDFNEFPVYKLREEMMLKLQRHLHNNKKLYPGIMFNHRD